MATHNIVVFAGDHCGPEVSPLRCQWLEASSLTPKIGYCGGREGGDQAVHLRRTAD